MYCFSFFVPNLFTFTYVYLKEKFWKITNVKGEKEIYKDMDKAEYSESLDFKKTQSSLELHSFDSKLSFNLTEQKYIVVECRIIERKRQLQLDLIRKLILIEKSFLLFYKINVLKLVLFSLWDFILRQRYRLKCLNFNYLSSSFPKKREKLFCLKAEFDLLLKFDVVFFGFVVC